MWSLEPRNVRERQLTAMHMHAAEFGATAQLREHLTRVEKMVRIKRAFDPHLLVKIGLVEHRAHEVAFFDPDAMFTRQNTADLNAEPQNIGAKLFRCGELSRDIGVVEYERMQIAVTSVEDVGDAKAVLCRERTHTGQYARQLLARNSAIHTQVIG